MRCQPDCWGEFPITKVTFKGRIFILVCIQIDVYISLTQSGPMAEASAGWHATRRQELLVASQQGRHQLSWPSHPLHEVNKSHPPRLGEPRTRPCTVEKGRSPRE